jgi:hypothetical protein
MQIEEIYDTAKDTDIRGWQTALRTEKSRADQLTATSVALRDIVEDFCAYARQSGNVGLARQGLMMWKNAGRLLESCGITRVGEEGQPLDPKIYTVHAAAVSPISREHVARVL